MELGANREGNIGKGTNVDCNIPVKILDNVKTAAGGDSHGLALMQNGIVKAWGRNGDGRLGNGTNITSIAPVDVIGLTNVTAISEGYANSFALRADGTVYAWGYNADGDLANETFSDSSLDSSYFILINEPAGVTVQGADYSSPTQAAITLAYDGTAINTEINNFRVRVAGSELTRGVDLTGNALYVGLSPKLAFSNTAYNAAENEESVTITVNRTGGIDESVTVDYATSNGTAISGSDYTVRTGTLTLEAERPVKPLQYRS